jgi:hypothetical protein
MVGKIRVRDCPKIERINLGSSLPDVRNCLPTIHFNESGIHILKLQPGVGKTHRIKRFLKGEKSFLIVTKSHKLLSSEYDEITSNHWYGFEHLCQNYKKVKKLKDSKVSIGIICELQGCNKKDCAYWKQFNKKKVIGPFHYLPTNRVRYKTGDRKFKFDLLVFDETLDKYETITLPKEQIDTSASIIDKYVPVTESIEEIYRFIGKNEIPPTYLVASINGRKNSAIKQAIGKREWDDVAEIAKLDVYQLRKFIYYYNIYEDIESYPEPYLYYALDLALQGVPVIFLDATFDTKAFEVLLGRYTYENSIVNRSTLINREIANIDDLRIKLYYSNVIKKEKKIYQMDKNKYNYRSGILRKIGDEEVLTENGKRDVKQLRDYIIESKRKYNSVGIVTYEPLETKFNDLGETEYFGNLRGSNAIKNVDALFIIGTPELPAKEVIHDFNNLALTNYKPKNAIKLTYRTRRGKHYAGREHKKPNPEKADFPLSYYAYTPREIDIYSRFYLSQLKSEDFFIPVDEKKPLPIACDSDDRDELLYLIPGMRESMLSDGVIYSNVYYPLPEFAFNLSESEKYQALHRARPFENKAEIYIFGDVPERAKIEFNLETLSKAQTERHFHPQGMYPLPLYRLIMDTYAQNSTLTSEEIAKKITLYKDEEFKSGYNSRLVTAIKKAQVTIEQITKIHEIIINSDLKDEKSIIKALRRLKVDKELIEYFIFYARDGIFVRTKT